MSTGIPNADEAQIKIEKIIDYLLSDSHPVGRSKARLLKSFGFSHDRPHVLIEAIRSHALTAALERQESSEFGIKYSMEGALTSPDGRNPNFRSIRMIHTGDSKPNFVTFFPI